LTRLDSRTPSVFTSGRGGAGNVHHPSERAIFSFDEELERELRREKDMAPVFHVGRGGAGNMIFSDHDNYSLSRKQSASTTSSTESAADWAKEKARKGWGKLRGIA
jgi:GTPase involved in cell partitioning and DNA repair